MKYMLLIHTPGDEHTSPEMYAEYGAFAAEVSERGKMIAGDELATSATLVRVRGGDRLVMDGPFTETKEVIGGYAVFSVNSKEEAIEWARRFMDLHLQHWPEWEGETELRELMEGPDCNAGH